MHSNFSSHS